MPKIFRKVALERLSSPEQLDQLMQVTNPQGWIALAALALLIGAALVWGLFGTIPTETTGEGILLRRGGVSELVATGSGPVEEVLVSVGDEVGEDQVVARIRQEGLLRQIDDTEKKLAELRAEYASLEDDAREQSRLNAANLSQQRSNLTRSVSSLERQLEILENRIEVQRELLIDGLITEQALLTLEQEATAVRDEIAANRLDLNGLELKRLQAERDLAQQLEARRSVLRDLESELRELRASLTENVNIVSPAAGRVLELQVDRGDIVSPGTPILSMEVVSEELMAVVFVPAALGKQIEIGMQGRVVPSTVKREEYGYMTGEVVHVDEFPSTSRGMLRLLANEELVGTLMEGGPLIRVDVSLTRDERTPTGYRWSSSRGPELEISSGTLASGSIIVREDRPLSLVLPRLREGLGG